MIVTVKYIDGAAEDLDVVSVQPTDAAFIFTMASGGSFVIPARRVGNVFVPAPSGIVNPPVRNRED